MFITYSIFSCIYLVRKFGCCQWLELGRLVALYPYIKLKPGMRHKADRTISVNNILISPTPSIEYNASRSQSAQNGSDAGYTVNQNLNSPRTTTVHTGQSIIGGSDDGQHRNTTRQQLPWELQAAEQQSLFPMPSIAGGPVIHTGASTTESSAQGQIQLDSPVLALNNMVSNISHQHTANTDRAEPRLQSLSQVPTGIQTGAMQQEPQDQLHVSPFPAQLPLPSTIVQGTSRASSGNLSYSYSNQGYQSPDPIANPPKRQRTNAPVSPSLKPRISLIHQYIKSIGGTQALSPLLERPRFALLEQACIEEDSFYLALHQLFCVWDANNQNLPNIHQFPAPEVLTMGFRILGQLIKSNSDLKANHLQWFAQFPAMLADLLQTSETYRQSISSSCNFLYKLGTEWDKLSANCRNRGYPPLVDELVETLGCLSPILQHIIFTASRRNLGFGDDNYGPQMEEIFRQDKSGHNSISRKNHVSTQSADGEVAKHNQELIQIYRQAIQRRTQTQQVQIIHARRASGSTSTQNPGASSNGRNAVSNGSMNSNQWNSAPNRPPGPNPSPITISGRGSSGQVTTGSPSPTFMQNLSMNPSNQTGQYVQYPYPPANLIGGRQTSSTQMDLQNSGASIRMQQMAATHHGQYLAHSMQRQQVAQQQQLMLAQQQRLHRDHPNAMQQQIPQLPQNPGAPQQIMNPRPFTVSSSTRASRPTPVLQSQSQVHHPVDVYGKVHHLERSLVPPIGFMQPSQPINPDMTALHQAHIRSPRLVAIDLDHRERFYQTVKHFAVDPVKIPFDKPLRSFQFTIDSNDFAMLARDKLTVGDKLATRFFRKGTIQYRFRCIRTTEQSNVCPLSEWTISDTAWPEIVYAELNGKALEIRRKNLHGKDLPVDITGILSQQNHLKLSIPKSKTGYTHFFFAIECVDILQHAQILELCSQNRIPLDTTIASIQKSMSISNNDDDDLQMVITDLSIDLADPFTARIFDVPIRSTNCLHRECFDLETFLQTRNSKPKRPKQPCMVDQWKCPLCGKDARPYNLRIDDFLLSVREKLAVEDNLETKAILVSASGEWRPKPLPQPQRKRGVAARLYDSDSDDGETVGNINVAQTLGNNASSTPKLAVNASVARIRYPAPQVIELDSD